MLKDFYFALLQYLDIHPLLIPLGSIGVWRWSVWMGKEIVARYYKPIESTYNANVSLVTPVYNENQKIFIQALTSWKENSPYEIIAVIDYTDKACIEAFRKFAKKEKNTRLIITMVPGKRPALARGIRIAKGEIVALVDSDTIWDKNVLKNGIAPFVDAKVAGVGTYQSVLHPKTLAQKIFDIQLDLRYCDEMPFLGAAGDALICLSGRTAFYRKKTIVPMLKDLVNETFLGKPVVSGDDKRLTYLVLAAGWKVKYQNNSRVYTPGMKGLHAYLQQRLRWSRNSLRADLRALTEGWPLKHPALLFFQIDKVLQAFVVILSPLYFLIALINKLWLVALLILIWWIVSRAIRMYPHLRRKPMDIALLPAFILYSIFTGVVKVYAFFTLNSQGWITRWHKSRLQKYRFLQLAPAYAATASVFIILLAAVFFYKEQTYFAPRKAEAEFSALTLQKPSPKQLLEKKTIATASAVWKDLLVRKYTIQEGETLSSVAKKFSVTAEDLLASNIARLTNWNILEPGFLLSIPGKDLHFDPQFEFNYQRTYDDVLQTSYDARTNTIIITGRGKNTTLTDIKNSVGEEYIKEIYPKVWLVSANISLHSGVTLTLSKEEATWIKLLSKKDKFVSIVGQNATIEINNVKITSWDDDANSYDTTTNDGRSFILVKNGSRMDIYDSELAYLGYGRSFSPDTSPYGVAWRLPPVNHNNVLLTGEVIHSKFHHNYFGVYTFGATGMTWAGNEFYDNIRYGFDPHDDSNGAIVEYNSSHNNGSHGFIISKRCIFNTFRNNTAYDNKLHGIMLHDESNNNIVENNIIYGNVDGIALWNAKNNIIRNNQILANKRGFRADDGSDMNIIRDNVINNNTQYAIYLYDNANRNIIEDNAISHSPIAFYVKANGNFLENNTIHDNKIGIYFLGTAENNIIQKNTMYYHEDRAIATKLPPTLKNYIDQNSLQHNRRDIYAQAEKPKITVSANIK